MKNAPLLIWGARKKSIGDAVRKMWIDMFDHATVTTAGISGEEDFLVNTSDEEEVNAIYEKVKPKFVLCTIGRNETLEEYGGPLEGWLQDMFDANVTTPMSLLNTWLEHDIPAGAQYIVISSNSAHIPRSNSMAYCATKAALSMAVRCAARDLQKAGFDLTVYGWEPGLVKGTPMSEGRDGTRMLGLPQGISRRSLAHQIVGAMAFGGAEYSGTLIRLDNGEV
jgi:NAD(P)-dependent dehydrogenase (short-subunit alcohol dehydrogenase family)